MGNYMFGKLFKSAPKTSAEETSAEIMEIAAVDTETVAEAKEVVDTETANDDGKIGLEIIGDTDITWDITKKGPTLLVRPADSDPANINWCLVKYAERNSDTLDYFTIDLADTLSEHRTEAQTKHIALTLDEAWDLSVALATEIHDRKLGKDGKIILVLVNEGHKLYRMTDVENEDRYSEMLINMQNVVENGEAVGIKLLQEVDADTVEMEARNDFQRVI
jgi:hypothetical protein